ncbi:MAG TPA: hypothetical protein VK186_18670 [Candidatus Deferrimicrobium sp.]|nr:hypothetical protein [Candidatus Deferrimicrobium sp.]
MYVKVTHGIPLFLKQTSELFEALKKGISPKNKLLRLFNITEQYLAECFVFQEKAESAQMAYEKATANLPETKSVFEKWCEEAITIFRKHFVHLMVALRYFPQKQLELGLIGHAEEKNIYAWLNNTLKFYNRLLVDRETIERMGNFNLKRQDFEMGQATFVDAVNAYLALTGDRPELKVIIDARDESVCQLTGKVSETQSRLLQAFAKDPRQLVQYGLPVLNDEIGREMSISMVKDSSITGMINGNHGNKEQEKRN